MFTGLIQHVGRVAELRPVPFGAELFVDSAGWSHQPAPGDSIAVNGCCLTVAGVEQGRWRFDVIRQTLEVTTLGGLKPGKRVNLEHSATPTTLLGGHLVQGHVDGVGRVTAVTRDASQWRVRVTPPPALAPLIVDKGAVAVEGVSLTVAAVAPIGGGEVAAPVQLPTWFEVALIPTTVERTTLGELAEGDAVNLESDCVVRAVAALLRAGWVEQVAAAPGATMRSDSA